MNAHHICFLIYILETHELREVIYNRMPDKCNKKLFLSLSRRIIMRYSLHHTNSKIVLINHTVNYINYQEKTIPSQTIWSNCSVIKDTLHPVSMRQPVVPVSTKHSHPVDAVDTKGCCCNTCFGRFRRVYPQHRINNGVADYLSDVSQSNKPELWIYFVMTWIMRILTLTFKE